MRFAWWKAAAVFIGFMWMPLAATAQPGTVTGSLHDLSVNGPGPAKATSESQVCLFCHAPHILDSESPHPLWNQKLTTVTSYRQYSSSTYKQMGNPVSTRSKLCLSCHDGTVAIGQTYSNGKIPIQGPFAAADKFGTDLSKNHPFGFTMPAVDDGEIKLSLTATPPATSDPAVNLFDNKIECVTCHDPHKPNNDTTMQFMVRSNVGGALCTACHDTTRGALKGWSAGKHATATNSVNAGAQLPYSTVAVNACASCHSGHNTSGTGARLLRGDQGTTCANCHGKSPNVSPALGNIIAEAGSTYSHPIGVPASPPHDPAESLPVSSSRHSECPDCHNPHAAQATTTGVASAPNLPPSLTGVSGIGFSGNLVNPARNESEICFKCHADSNNKPQSALYSMYGREPIRATRSTDPFNVRLDLNSTVARHNVVQPARPGISPSLRTTMLDLMGNPTGRSLLSGAYIDCADCHNNDAARASGGTAPNGPHGSKWTHILERQFQQNSIPPQGAGANFASIPYSPGISSPYALCDKCHDLDNKLSLSGAGTDSAFGKHQIHVVRIGASCSVCHATHGVQGGTMSNNKHLVNFDTQIVAAYGTNPQPYIDTARKRCFLVCHGVTHKGTNY